MERKHQAWSYGKNMAEAKRKEQINPPVYFIERRSL
jgi:hypothetical protein